MWQEGGEDKVAEKTVEAIRAGDLTLRGAMANFRHRHWANITDKGGLDQILIDKESLDEVRRMCKVLAPFFNQYDQNGDHEIDFEEFRLIFRDVNENLNAVAQRAMFKAADTDHSGSISFEEFVACFMSFALDDANDLTKEEAAKEKKGFHKLHSPEKRGDDVEVGSASASGEASDDEDDHENEEEDVPEDLLDLEPEEQQKVIKKRAAIKLGLGTLLVLLFSDPTVDLLSEAGSRTGINHASFYISFVLAPMASNASELFSAASYAMKRTQKSMTTSLSTLLGAGIMNNTFCLGIFFALIFFGHLAWEFTAETISICLVQIMVAVSVMFRQTQRLLDAYIFLLYYPLSLGIVYVLEEVFLFD
jgi:Ca2+/Na+ antiporter